MKLTKYNDLVEDGLVLHGTWKLTPNHQLQFRSEEKQKDVKIIADLLGAEANALVASYTEKYPGGKTVTGLLKLQGTWQTDSKNRITFQMSKENGPSDVLTFKGAWKVGPSHELIYTYGVTCLKTKKKETRELVFDGVWDISDNNSLVYSLSAASGSAFRFRSAFQTKSILAKKGEIRYQAGVEVQGKRKTQVISLFGKWKFSKILGLSFEIEYKDGRRRSITFGADYSPGDDHQVCVDLKSAAGKPLGIQIVFTKDFFGKDGQAFLRFQKSAEESRTEAGVKIKW